MKSLARLYHHYRARISLKGFMRVIGQPYWRLRDYLRVGAARRHRARVQARASAWVQAVATAEPTYGYRRVYQTLRQQHRLIGRERVRRWMDLLFVRWIHRTLRRSNRSFFSLQPPVKR